MKLSGESQGTVQYPDPEADNPFLKESKMGTSHPRRSTRYWTLNVPICFEHDDTSSLPADGMLVNISRKAAYVRANTLALGKGKLIIPLPNTTKKMRIRQPCDVILAPDDPQAGFLAVFSKQLTYPQFRHVVSEDLTSHDDFGSRNYPPQDQRKIAEAEKDMNLIRDAIAEVKKRASLFFGGWFGLVASTVVTAVWAALDTDWSLLVFTIPASFFVLPVSLVAFFLLFANTREANMLEAFNARIRFYLREDISPPGYQGANALLRCLRDCVSGAKANTCPFLEESATCPELGWIYLPRREQRPRIASRLSAVWPAQGFAVVTTCIGIALIVGSASLLAVLWKALMFGHVAVTVVLTAFVCACCFGLWLALVACTVGRHSVESYCNTWTYVFLNCELIDT